MVSAPLSRPVGTTSPCRPHLAVGGGRGFAAAVRCQAQAGHMDALYMRRCVELARKAAGHTSPNPMVGCVIVRNGRVVGEGFNPKSGQPHAEFGSPPLQSAALHPPSIMASECESGDVVPHLHLHPHGTEPLAHIAVDYCPDACHHAPASGEIYVTYDHRGGARWRSRRRFLPGGAVAATIRAPAGDTAGLNYNLYLSSLEGSRDMDEIDFEFLGRDKRAVQTNFHVAGGGGREQIHELPFDSSDGFHHYAIAWGAEVIEWRIDGELIRKEERRAGEPWPEKPMFLYASVWDASDIDEGRWTGTYHGRDAPYVCSYRDVRVPVALSVEEEEEECQDANAGDAFDAAAAVEEVVAGAGKD